MIEQGRRFVLISDLHIHPWAAFAQGDGIDNSRLQRSLHVLEESLKFADGNNLPWVFAGDIVHTAGHALNIVLSGIVRTMHEFRSVTKLAVWGNHDARGVGSQIELPDTVWDTLRESVDNLYMLEKWPVQRNGLMFAGRGYQPAEKYFQYADTTDVGVYHQTVRGSHSPAGFKFDVGLEPDELTHRHHVAIVGHVHHPQTIGDRILIPGSPEHHNFGDRGTHGWWVVSVPTDRNESPIFQFMPSGSPEFRTVDTIDEVNLSDNHYYRVRRQPPPGTDVAGTVIMPSPVTVAIRDRTLAHGTSVDQVLATWMAAHPPEHADPKLVLEIGQGLIDAHEHVTMPRVRVHSIAIRDFCCFADATLTIRDGIHLVVGRGHHFPSNGAGKSTMFEALFWCLFGRTTKGLTGDDVIRWGTDAASVTVTIDIDGVAHRVVRERKAKRTTLTVARRDENVAWSAPSVSEMTQRLGDRLGLTPELFQALGYFSQERLMLFASATDGERKSMLADLLGLGAYQSAATTAGSNVVALTRTVGSLATERETWNTVLQQEQGIMRQADIDAAAWDREHENLVAAASREWQEFEASEAKWRATLMAEAAERFTRDHTREMDSLIAERREIVGRLPMSLEEWNTAVDDIAGRLRVAEAAVHTTNRDSREWFNTVAAATRRAESAHDRVRKFAEALADGTCPTCEQPVTPEHRDRCLMEPRNVAAAADATLREVQSQLDATIAKMREHQSVVDTVAQQRSQLESFRPAYTRLVDIDAKLAAVHTHMASVGPAITDLVEQQIARKRDALRAAVDGVFAAVNPHTTKYVGAQKRAQNVSEKLDKLMADETRGRAALAAYEYWQHGFSKQGIQSLLMDHIADAFNAARGDVFPLLTQGVYDVQFDTVSVTKAGDARERTAFVVFEKGKPIAYESLSGGQRRRIDIGVMLVLVLAVSTWLNIPGALGMLVLDEVFGFLDMAGAEGLMDALHHVQATIPAVYAVTHDPQFQTMFPNMVRVEQNDEGISTIMDEHYDLG